VIVIFRPADNSLWGYCVRRGWQDEEIRVVTDLDALLRGVRGDRVEIVLASSLTGLGRSVPELVQMLREFVVDKTVLIVPGRFDTSKLSSKVFLDTLDAIEEFKHAATVEAINEGLAAAKARGVRLGRRVKVDGYSEDVARPRAQGLTGRAIAKELGVPSANVFKVLKHPVA
jgi:DNA invertase Pin-like site-specific DNA recombinase